MSISSNFAKSYFLRASVGAASSRAPGVCTSAEAASPAEDFVQTNVQHGLSILNNGSLPKDQTRGAVPQLPSGPDRFEAHFATYTLGPVKNTASPADLAAFDDAFRDYAFAVYETELSKYSGQTLSVTGSVSHGANDNIVTTQLIDPIQKANRSKSTSAFRSTGSLLGRRHHRFGHGSSDHRTGSVQSIPVRAQQRLESADGRSQKACGKCAFRRIDYRKLNLSAAERSSAALSTPQIMAISCARR